MRLPRPQAVIPWPPVTAIPVDELREPCRLTRDACSSRIAQATGIRAASCVDLTHADVVPMHPIDSDGPCGGSAARPVGEPAGTRERRPDPSTARAMSVSLGDLLAEQPARCDSGRAALPFR